MLPLDGIRVIDLSQGVSGPFSTRLLADQGADVIKVESPTLGDPARRLAPFANTLPGSQAGGTFQYVNLGKRGITLNIASDSGRRVLRELAAGAHILVESFEPGVLDTLSVGFRELSTFNPGLVMTSVTNFGQTGPYRHFKSDEITQYSMGGPMSVTGSPDHPPLNLADGIVSPSSRHRRSAGHNDRILRNRGDGGRGASRHVHYGDSGRQYRPTHSHVPCIPVHRRPRQGAWTAGVSAVSGVLPTSNGHIAFDAATPAAMKQLPTLIDAPELAHDPRFTDPDARQEPENSEMLQSTHPGVGLEPGQSNGVAQGSGTSRNGRTHQQRR